MWVTGVVAPKITDVSIDQMSHQLHTQTLSPPPRGMRPQYPLDRMLGGPHLQSGYSGGKETLHCQV
jgi:hypothetical protein